MGMGPRHTLVQNQPGAVNNQQQDYMQQFNNSPYAAIPGVRGPLTMPQAPVGTFNGQPIDYSNRGAPPSRWNSLFSGLRADYMNGTFSNSDWQTMLPGASEGGPGQVQGGMVQNHMVQPTPVAPQMMSGPYGRQASQMAGLLGQPSGGNQSGGALLGGGLRGFRIPGGK